MNWSLWLNDNWPAVTGMIRAYGLRGHVYYDDLDDFVGRVAVRLLDSRPHNSENARWGLVKVVSQRQAVDDTRLRMRRPQTVPLDDAQRTTRDAYGEFEILDAVKRLGHREARAVLGPVFGIRDEMLADHGQSRAAVSQRRHRVRERLAA